MDRLIFLIIMCIAPMITSAHGEDMTKYMGFEIGSYVDQQLVKNIDVQHTLSEGYVCFRDKQGMVYMSFDIALEETRLMSVEFFLNRNAKPGLQCTNIKAAQPVTITVPDFPCQWENVEKCLMKNGLHELKARFENIRLYGKLLQREEKCFNVRSELEGNYSYQGVHLKRLRVVLTQENGSLYSVRFATIFDLAEMSKLFKSLNCELEPTSHP